ncbi:MAG TPA: NAD/NADP octopine/nopaline dehydrogenase family protein [Flavobacterium sp.]|nr:NAD/NADP octopine/nopaline dehydrogenase family protein [Flavobacterium sp.]
MKIGIYGISSQSGKAYLADLLSRGVRVVGYARATTHGTAVVDAILNEKGIYLNRPSNTNNEESRFIDLGQSIVTSDIKLLVDESDVIIIAVPSNFHEEIAIELKQYLNNRSIPFLLSPSRTIASPYLWNILGENYPIVCFSTSPFSCKSLSDNTVYIKRRKRTWLASFEGSFTSTSIHFIKGLFPQVTFTDIPALTSLNNIGAIFHPTAYILNLEEINKRNQENRPFSFYMEGIANKPEVGLIIEKIDQTRLEIADKLGIPTFGLKSNPREDIWRRITNALRSLEEENENDIDVLRKTRGYFLEYINHCVISAQHWLDITYGVIRIPDENLAQAIARTPTYQTNSVPQERYVDEDIPTGLVPLEALAKKIKINHLEITHIINAFDIIKNTDIRHTGRNLEKLKDFDVINYLKGNTNE